MIWKTVIAASIVAMIIAGVIWVNDGMHTFTKDRESVVTKIVDELFGTEREEVTWVDKFTYGLLPDDMAITSIHRSYAFVLGIGFSAIALSFFMMRRNKS
ncbi:MAG: hypothetical protein HQ472_10140 [Ignavibacteria bacterium]|nr:hypothetical protein [Ignavibacteria bacterium]